MSELIHKVNYISFEEFIPNWTEIVKEMDEKEIGKEYKDKVNFNKSLRDQKDFRFLGEERVHYARDKGLNYMVGNQCLVGEGHKGNGDYSGVDPNKKCDTCKETSYRDAYEAMSIGGEYFNDFKHALYNHTMLEHPDLLVKQ